ncbi:hypothetical protein KQI41_10815 [Tissierella pigra]|uniref:DUF4179 domain-containing protein n=1 Tax=Tissierella pigra TaxID=2607614 RepID=A0A6N7Y335_9FIRM|nr:hypothetical protein [Tissierella pigra]MBU5426902.1 hypothetical protein [Tissierella pigra]MSU03284.1 hypothetical protein [Tissierella pigra]
MNNLENLKDYIDNNMKSIRITDNTKRNIQYKIRKNKHNRLKPAAVIILPIMILSLLAFNEQISYAAQKLFSYLPGINKIFYNDGENKVYGLLGSVEVSDKEKYIKVNAAYNEDKTVTLTMEGNVTIEKEIERYITIVDEENNKAKLKSSDIIINLDDYQWSARCTYEFRKVTNNFNIIYDKFNIPVIMTELPEIPLENHNYISIKNINADIAVVTGYVENKLEVNILSQSSDEVKSISFPLKEIYLLDSKGNKFYSIDNNNENILYFDKKLENGIKLVIPHIFITDNDVRSNVSISKYDSLPVKFSLGDNELVINNAEWDEYNEKFNYRTPENSNYRMEEKAQKINLAISKSLVGTNELKLQNISADVNKDQLNEYMVEDVRVIWDDPYRDADSQISEEEDIKIILSNIKNIQDKVDITFYAPVYSTCDKVIIPLRP